MAANTATITWNVAGTNTGAVNCSNVDIILSTDGGVTFTDTLAANTANDGTQDITIPSLATSDCGPFNGKGPWKYFL